MVKIMTEASGSLVAGYLIRSIKEAGFIAVASDVDNESVGRYLADEFIEMPHKNDPELWDKVLSLLEKKGVNVVIPSFDETLNGWAERKDMFFNRGIYVVISEINTIKTFVDKWLTYLFFTKHGIPSPATSIEQVYPLIKPRQGRGGSGILVTEERMSMNGMISQEFIKGEEYTIDVFCNRASIPVYIVPRKRLGVKNGKSTGGIVVDNPHIVEMVNKICMKIPFIGPVNFQCMVCKDSTIKFIEVNPRVAGGMALGFAATENWIKLIVDHFIDGKDIVPKKIKYGMKMKRYYAEVFIS